MSTTTITAPTIPSTDTAYVLAADEGIRHHFLNNLATTKVTGAESGSLSVVEFLAPRGFGPPLHEHRDEDEIVIVIEGEIAFRSGDTETIATTGATAFLPHAVPHTFQVLSDRARIVSITARVDSTTAPNFDAMVAALGQPTDSRQIPAPMDIDPGEVAQVCDAHGISVLGPPPAMI
jgi:quercetin dioxygenase-like cupin family protein